MDFKKKIQTISTPRKWGNKNVKPVINEDTGGVAGKHIEHWDDRQDAVATPPTLQIKVKVKEG